MKYYLTLTALIFSLSLFAGGPWLVPKKSGFIQIQSTFPSGAYDNLFLSNGESLKLNRGVLDYNFQGYLEYGISNKLNVIAVLPYKYIATTNSTQSQNNFALLPKGSLNGWGNIKLGVKYPLLTKNIKAAIMVQTSLNTINKNFSKGLATGYDANSVGLYGSIGKSISSQLYSYLEGGWNVSSNNFSDFIEVHYELGYQPASPLWLAITIDIRSSLKNGTYQNDNLKQTGFYTNDQEYFAYGIKSSYELKNQVGITAATFGAFSGNYVAKIATFSIGVYKKF